MNKYFIKLIIYIKNIRKINSFKQITIFINRMYFQFDGLCDLFNYILPFRFTCCYQISSIDFNMIIPQAIILLSHLLISVWVMQIFRMNLFHFKIYFFCSLITCFTAIQVVLLGCFWFIRVWLALQPIFDVAIHQLVSFYPKGVNKL